MAPNTTNTPTGGLFEDAKLDDSLVNPNKSKKSQTQDTYKLELVWLNIIFFTYAHIGALYGICLIFTSAKIATTIFTFFLVILTGVGIGAGVHRLWSHRSYKAKRPLRVLLAFLNTMAFQMPTLTWARDHRLHHKYSETNANPQSSNRGIFFSHLGCLLCRKHPDVLEKAKGIDMSDLYADQILRFQKKYYPIVAILCCFVLPTAIPVYFWNETWSNAYHTAALLRWLIIVHVTMLINSYGHRYGKKPYDKSIRPSDNLSVCIATFGEGWHNYHHTFPWDYRSTELGDYSFNFATGFINFFAAVGWAYDLKSATPDMIRARVQRTGDGSHQFWGWGDEDMTKEDQEGISITHKKIL